ncbi:hypothetical protein AYO44_03080 [Planctomycetaceae bacterium SCGC AG-212-F19]|nr:hypothetical protein AYO44_03080 [Planctomycetaceae bacterium SCGC AG-212-F19]
MSERNQAGGSFDREQLITLLAAQLEQRSLPGAMETVTVLLRRNPRDRDALDLRALLDEQLNTLASGQVGALRTLTGHQCWVNAVAYSPDGRRIVSGSGGSLSAGPYQDGADRSVRIWNSETGRGLFRFKGHRSAVQAIAYAPDGRRFLTASRRGCITLWDAAFLTVVRHFQLGGAAIASIAFGPDGRGALSGSDDKTLCLWNVRDGTLLRRFEGHTGPLSSVAVAADGKTALSGSFDRTVRLWDMATGKLVRRLDGHSQLVQCVAFAGHGQALSAGADQAIILWDLSTGKEVRRFAGHTNRVNSIAFSPEGRFVLSGSADNTVRVWDVTNGRELRCLGGHSDHVLCVAFSPDGVHAVSGSRDMTLRLWQLPSVLETLQDGGAGFNLVEELRASDLLDTAQVAELAELGPQYTDPRALAWHILERGWVTTHQINQLILKRTASLFHGPYVVLDRLGEGGMGQVLKGQHRESREMVALKVPRTEVVANPEDAKLFWWERQALARLAHPNIVALHTAHDKGDRPFIALEFIPGADLEVLVQQSGPLPPGLAAAFLHQAALGLEHARQRNLIHRDIKPANLIPVREAETHTYCVKVLDWGLADVRPRGAEGSPLGPRDMVGTADYMAPEQANDPQSTDIRSDIYSLGCTAYFLLTGHPPFAGCSLAEKLVRHQMREPKPVEELRSDLPAGLADVIRKMMAKKPEDRYQTPAAAADALAPFARDDEAENAASQRMERRRSERYPCAFPIRFQLPLHASETPLEGTAVDISATGLRFRAAEEQKPGTILSLKLAPLGDQEGRTLLARVIHVRQDDAGGFEMGCAFARPMSEEEVRMLRGEEGA